MICLTRTISLDSISSFDSSGHKKNQGRSKAIEHDFSSNHVIGDRDDKVWQLQKYVVGNTYCEIGVEIYL